MKKFILLLVVVAAGVLCYNYFSGNDAEPVDDPAEAPTEVAESTEAPASECGEACCPVKAAQALVDSLVNAGAAEEEIAAAKAALDEVVAAAEAAKAPAETAVADAETAVAAAAEAVADAVAQ